MNDESRFSLDHQSRDIPEDHARTLPRLPLHVLADNLRSAFNVGGVLRTTDAAGGQMVHLAGYTARPPHPRVKRAAQGAENLIAWKAWPDARLAVAWLKERGFTLVGLEPSANACDFRKYDYSWPLCVVVGNEAVGIAPALGKRLDGMIRIPMHGGKSSLNVVVALGILLSHVVTHPARPSVEMAAENQVDTESAVSSIVHRAITAFGVTPVWRAHDSVKLGLPALVLFLESPSLPPCDVWALPRLGGVLLHIQEQLAESVTRSGRTLLWTSIATERIARKRTHPFSSALPNTPRAEVFSAEMGLWRTLRAKPPFQRLALDSYLFSLLERHDPMGRLTPYVTRYVGADDKREMQSMAALVLRELSRPLGGPWREAEVLVVPHETGRHDTLDRLVRYILFGASRM